MSIKKLILALVSSCEAEAEEWVVGGISFCFELGIVLARRSTDNARHAAQLHCPQSLFASCLVSQLSPYSSIFSDSRPGPDGLTQQALTRDGRHEAGLVLSRGIRRLQHQDHQPGLHWVRPGQRPQILSSAGKIFVCFPDYKYK